MLLASVKLFMILNLTNRRKCLFFILMYKSIDGDFHFIQGKLRHVNGVIISLQLAILTNWLEHSC